MDRRTFLSIVAGSPLVFGLQEILGQETPQPKPRPEWYEAALKRMKETRRYGVVLVIPAGRKGQVRLGEAILARLSRPELEDNEIFCEVVFLCLTQAQAENLGNSPLEGDRTILDGVYRLLLDPNGNKVAGDRIDLSVLETRVSFRRAFDDFVHGDNGERLQAHRKEIEKTLSPEIIRAAELLSKPRARLTTEEERVPFRAAMDLLRDHSDDIAPWLIRHSKLIGAGPFRVVLWEYFLNQSELDPEPCLPYGVRVERFSRRPGCGEAVLGEMARIRLTDYRFLHFLTK